MKKILALILMLLVLGASLSVSAQTVQTNEIPYESYTYWEGFSGKGKKAVYCKPMYEAKSQITSNSLGIKQFSGLGDVVCDSKGYTYILDSLGSRIVILDENYKLKKEIFEIENNGVKLRFSGSKGLFVTDNGNIYIADTENSRVIVSDENGKLKEILELPQSNLIPEDFYYRPISVTVGNDGEVYVLSEGSYYGAIVYNEHREFNGFFGANSAKKSVLEGVLNFITGIFMTDSKREASQKNLPYQFSDLAIDSKGFVYTTTGKTETETNSVGQIKKLSPAGNSILDGDAYNYVDEGVSDVNGQEIASHVQDLLSIAVDKNEYIYALDSTYGRIFVYNKKNKLLNAFSAGNGNSIQVGSFKQACSIAVKNGEILVCDSNNNNITIFSPTEYGKNFMQADMLTKEGRYSEAKDIWENILKQDANNQIAYSGLALICLQQEDFKNALEYSKSGYDREIYRQAFKEVRSEFLNKYFTVIFIGIILLIALLIAFVLYKKKKGIVLIKNRQIKLMLSTIRHPFDTFGAIREKKDGSIKIGIILIALYYVVTVLKSIYGGFQFNFFDTATFNSLFVFVRSIGVVILWTVCNWAVCTLMGGNGTLRNIFVSTTYCLLPLIFGDAVYLIASNILTADEGAFLSLFLIVMAGITFIYLAIAMINIHDYTFGKFLLTALITVFGILLIIFIAFLIGILLQQLGGFILTIFKEVKSVMEGRLW